MRDLATAPEQATSGLSGEAAILVIYGQWRSLHGIAMSLLRDSAAAQDVVADVVEAVLRVQPSFDGEREAIAYARTAVVNRCRSALRHRTVAQRFLRRSHEESAPPADESALLAEDHREVLAQFERLPARQREVLVLRHFALLSDPEIADIMSISEVTVRTNASRGLSALARHLKENS